MRGARLLVPGCSLPASSSTSPPSFSGGAPRSLVHLRAGGPAQLPHPVHIPTPAPQFDMRATVGTLPAIDEGSGTESLNPSGTFATKGGG